MICADHCWRQTPLGSVMGVCRGCSDQYRLFQILKWYAFRSTKEIVVHYKAYMVIAKVVASYKTSGLR